MDFRFTDVPLGQGGRTTSNATYGNFYHHNPAATSRQRTRRHGNLLAKLSTDPEDLPDDDALWDLEKYYERLSCKRPTHSAFDPAATAAASALAPLGDPPSSWPENIHSFGYGYQNPLATGYYGDSTPRHYTDLTRPVDLVSDGPSTLIAPSLPFVTPQATQPNGSTLLPPPLLSDRGLTQSGAASAARAHGFSNWSKLPVRYGSAFSGY